MDNNEKTGFLSSLKNLVSIPDDTDDDLDEELEEEQETGQTGEEPRKEKEEPPKEQRRVQDARQYEEGEDPLRVRFLWMVEDIREWLSDHFRTVAVTAAVLLILILFFVYNRNVTFDGYRIAASYENLATAGTYYQDAGKYLFKYNGDGISCVNRNNDIRWSTTYSIQAPVSDLCGTCMAVAEQQGTHVYVVDTDGEVGSFETTTPILKVRVSRQGLTALILQEDDVTWVNLYQPDGTLVASDKTTIMESGYPIDMALSPDGQRIMVSYVKLDGGVLSDDIVFYHFGAAGQNKDDHIVARWTYDEVMIPDLYFADNDQAVALAENGFYVYSGKDTPKEAAQKLFEKEIISTFHEGKSVGYVFENTQEESDKLYHIELYDLRGKRTAKADTDCSYSDIRMMNGQILLFNDRSITAVTTSGKERLHTAYEKTVNDVFYFKEYRKYLVITSDSFDKIRIGSKG